MTDYEYKLLLNSDVNSYGHNHWYYFKVTNPRKTSITFRIINMLKLDDLYQAGMQPAVFSQKYFEKNGIKWHRDGIGISYLPNPDSLPGKTYYTLSFTYDFRYSGDTVSFAYSIPYTHHELSLYLDHISEKFSKVARVNTLCKTLAGNNCQMLTITENISSYFTFEEETHEWGISNAGRRMIRNKKKRANMLKIVNGKEIVDEHQEKMGIVITARVHPGETVSSFMVKGVIDFLLGETREAKILRKNFVFKIVPMLNPDGVRFGNYRCSLIGVDLNRRWKKPSKNLHPTIFYTKKMIEVFGEHHKIKMSCDMHGHSKKFNVFMYGCSQKSNEGFVIRRNLLAKVVPFAMHRKSKFFTFSDCHFRLEKSKAATMRIVVFNDFSITHSYTIEASFFGPRNKKCIGENYHMNEIDLQSVGEDLCRVSMMFISQRFYFKKIRSTNEYLRKIMMKRNREKENKEINEENSEDIGKDEQNGDENQEIYQEENKNIKDDTIIAENDEKGNENNDKTTENNDKAKENHGEVEENSEKIEKKGEDTQSKNELPIEKILEESPLREKKKKNEKIRKNFSKRNSYKDSEGSLFPSLEIYFQNLEKISNNTEKLSQNSEKSSLATDRISLNLEKSPMSIEKIHNPEEKSYNIEEDEMWNDIEIVNYIESDEEGSGGSDSCPSEKLEEIEDLNKKKKKKDKKKEEKPKHENFSKIDIKPEFSQSNIDKKHKEKDEKLKKTYSLKPKFRAIQSRKGYSKESHSKNSTSPVVPNLRSLNILFNPLPLGLPQNTEKPSDFLNKIQKDLTKKKSNFLKSDITEDLQTITLKNMAKVPNILNHSYEIKNYKRNQRDFQNAAIFNTNQSIISDFSWVTSKGGYGAKNFADSTRFKIDKLYSKFD